LLAGVMLIGLAGCGAAYAPLPAPNTLDMDAAHWDLLYGAGTPSHPAASQTGLIPRTQVPIDRSDFHLSP
jgi:hypothetical protein